MEGNLRFKIDWAGLLWLEVNLPFLPRDFNESQS